jgi:Glycosyltransferase
LEDKNVTIIPFIDKNNKEEMELLDSIYRKAHFLILPTEFDAYGIVFCEASAYGVPSIAPNVGGVSQPIKEGKNGYLMSPSASAEDYAKLIKKYFLIKRSI